MDKKSTTFQPESPWKIAQKHGKKTDIFPDFFKTFFRLFSQEEVPKYCEVKKKIILMQ